MTVKHMRNDCDQRSETGQFWDLVSGDWRDSIVSPGDGTMWDHITGSPQGAQMLRALILNYKFSCEAWGRGPCVEPSYRRSDKSPKDTVEPLLLFYAGDYFSFFFVLMSEEFGIFFRLQQGLMGWSCQHKYKIFPYIYPAGFQSFIGSRSAC